MRRLEPAAPSPTGRERILLAAERLIAERGPNVPLRDLALAAGQRNNSAVQYHFVDRDALVAAVLDLRLPSLERRRLELLGALEAEGRSDDPAGLIKALALPMFELLRREGVTHYARFLEQVRMHPSLREVGAQRSKDNPALLMILVRLGRALGHLPAALREPRLAALGTVLFGLLADHERALEAGALDAKSEALARADILNILVATLLAPAPVRAANRRS